MRKDYDFTASKPNLYIKRLKKSSFHSFGTRCDRLFQAAFAGDPHTLPKFDYPVFTRLRKGSAQNFFAVGRRCRDHTSSLGKVIWKLLS